ncbi:MAG: DUF2336 domain-containing protein [Candidatus Competibacteraceae bacterium]|nr:DUF2336 domain-containing protein [Candidatus Competibacteraceae bacterium]
MLQGFSLSGLEDVAAGEDSPRRDAILSALTDQYLELEPRLSDRHIELYDNVFRVLVSGIELQARLALSEKLAAVKRAPREIIRDLANDEYAVVATPVLQRSPLLDEIDLVNVARNRSEAHRAALAQRPNLHTVVTDVLVDRREQSVLVALIALRYSLSIPAWPLLAMILTPIPLGLILDGIVQREITRLERRFRQRVFARSRDSSVRNAQSEPLPVLSSIPLSPEKHVDTLNRRT